MPGAKPAKAKKGEPVEGLETGDTVYVFAARIISSIMLFMRKDCIDMVGKRFGHLSVIEYAPRPRREGGSRWRCLCDCGITKDVLGNDLRRGATVSCGCKRDRTRGQELVGRPSLTVKDLTGQRFGKLVALRPTVKNKHGSWIWECLCDCGVTKEIWLNSLRTGNTASCGCSIHLHEIVRSDRVRARRNTGMKERYRHDAKFRINRLMRAGVSACLKTRRQQKRERTFAALGYDVAALEAHLRKTIPAGSTWNDFLSGTLHIDHIIPLSAFNFQSTHDIDFRRAWALTNLRLLPGPENVAKSDKLSAAFQPALRFG